MQIFHNHFIDCLLVYGKKYYLQVNCAYKFIGKQIKDNFGENAFETDEK